MKLLEEVQIGKANQLGQVGWVHDYVEEVIISVYIQVITEPMFIVEGHKGLPS